MSVSDEPENQELAYFLYVLIKETDGKSNTNLRIVNWHDGEGFVVYGDRAPVGSAPAEYVTYRLRFTAIEQVLQLVKTVMVPGKSSVIELHQFVGITDNSKDPYHIDWQNTPEDKSTEIVAFDAEYQPLSPSSLKKSVKIDFHSTLENLLSVLENSDVV